MIIAASLFREAVFLGISTASFLNTYSPMENSSFCATLITYVTKSPLCVKEGGKNANKGRLNLRLSSTKQAPLRHNRNLKSRAIGRLNGISRILVTKNKFAVKEKNGG